MNMALSPLSSPNGSNLLVYGEFIITCNTSDQDAAALEQEMRVLLGDQGSDAKITVESDPSGTAGMVHLSALLELRDISVRNPVKVVSGRSIRLDSHWCPSVTEAFNRICAVSETDLQDAMVVFGEYGTECRQYLDRHLLRR